MKKLDWILHVQYAALVNYGDARLVVNCTETQGEWIAMALETSREGLVAVLDNHSHRSLGTFRTETKAKRACHQFALEWLKNRTLGKLCSCDEIRLPEGNVSGPSAKKKTASVPASKRKLSARRSGRAQKSTR